MHHNDMFHNDMHRTFGQTRFASGGGAEHLLAVAAHDHGLGVREHGGAAKMSRGNHGASKT